MLNWNKFTKSLRQASYFFTFALLLISQSLAAADNYVIGAPISLTGANADNGHKILNSLQLYVDQVNKNGGVDGHHLELKVLDDKSDPEEAKKNAQTLAGDKSVIAVVGHSEQATANAAAPVYVKGNLLLFTPSQIDEKLSKDNEWIYSGMYSEKSQQEMLSAYISIFNKNHDITVVNALGDKNTSTKVDDFVAIAKKADLNITVINATDASKFKDSKKQPGAIVLFAQPKVADSFLKDLRQFDKETPVYGDDSILGLVATHLTESYATNIYGTFPFSFSIASYDAQRFAQAYSTAYKADPSISATFAYDGATLIARGLRQANVDRNKIRDYFKGLNSVETGQAGLTGRLYFDDTNHIFHNMIMSGPFLGSIKPNFDQIKLAPANVNKSDSEHEVVTINKTNYYKISIVYIGLDFKKITKLNTTTKEVEVDTFLWLKWKGDLDIESIAVQNQASPTKWTQIKKSVIQGEGDNQVNYGLYTAKVALNYNFQLQSYPFDRQIIPITISHSTLDSNRIILAVESEFLNKRPINHQEWDYLVRLDSTGLFSYDSTLGNYKRSEAGTNVKPEYSTYDIYLVVKRKIFSYIFSLFLPLTIIIFICFMAFMIRLTGGGDVNSRRGLVTGMLFATVVSHLAMRNALQTTYLVAADYFYLLTYVVICAEMLVFSIEGLMIDNLERTRKVDRIAMFAIIGGTLLIAASLIFKFVL